MATCDTRLATRVSAGVDARLRMLAIVEKRRVCDVLDGLLSAVLPPADELAGRLPGSRPTADYQTPRPAPEPTKTPALTEAPTSTPKGA